MERDFSSYAAVNYYRYTCTTAKNLRLFKSTFSAAGLMYRLKTAARVLMSTDCDVPRFSAFFEPFNPYDRNAIAIYYNKRQFGYVPKFFAEEISALPRSVKDNLYLRPAYRRECDIFFDIVYPKDNTDFPEDVKIGLIKIQRRPFWKNVLLWGWQITKKILQKTSSFWIPVFVGVLAIILGFGALMLFLKYFHA